MKTINLMIDCMTWLKAKPMRSSLKLLDKEKAVGYKWKRLEVTEVSAEDDYHTSLTLKKPILAIDGKTTIQKVYVHTPHIRYIRNGKIYWNQGK